MTTELKPCPFCGGECDPEGWLGGYKTTGPECSSCGATAENVAAWNRRAALSPASTGQEATSGEGPFGLALNVQHPKCHEAANAFWDYWRENGETHKRGYYESTWGAINRAIKLVGVVPWTYGGKIPAFQFPAPAQQVEAEIRGRALEEAAKAIGEWKSDEDPLGKYVERNAAVRAIRALKSAAGSNNGEKG